MIPAALENQITGENAARIKASVIVGIPNGTATTEADAVLKEWGTLVVPDILANAGGVTVSYFEWVQNKAGFCWPFAEACERLERIISTEFNAVYDLMHERNLDMRTAAYTQALSRIGTAIQAQGTHRFFSNRQGKIGQHGRLIRRGSDRGPDAPMTRMS